MKMIRITSKEKPALKNLEYVWEAPDDQDVITEDIIKWLRKNIYRHDVGLWVGIHEGQIVCCIIAMGPSILYPAVHIYCAWKKKGAKVDTKEFFDGEFTKWVRGFGCSEITMFSCGHTARAWERKFGFKTYTRMYRRSLDPVQMELSTSIAEAMEAE